MDRINEIQARLAEIAALIDTATGDALTALETESRSLLEELNGLRQVAQTRQQLRDQIAAGAGTRIPSAPTQPQSAEERAAAAFAQTNRMTIGAAQTRSTLISGGKLAAPTQVDGINGIPGAAVSSIIDLVKVVNCTGMGSHKVAYLDANANTAPAQTEGAAATAASLGTFGFVTISPESIAVLDYISKQAKKQTPLQYAAKVREQALVALRKAAAAKVVGALKSSTLNSTVTAKVVSTKGAVDETTLRDLALAYGGDESVVGGAMLFLNKADLIAFGDVRGTNEKRAVYKITPDPVNPNTGIIEEGGLSVRYCMCSGLTACSGTAQSASTAQPTMFYGSPQCLELDLFSDYEVKVSEDFAFDKLMDTIRGDVEIGAGVVVKNGFVALTIAKS